ncbi:MAG: acyl carrier protein [Bacteroidota bacterium]
MEQNIIRYIQEELLNGREDIELEAEDNLLTEGLIESMSMLRLIQFIEEEHDLKVQPQDMTIENFMSVEAIVQYIQRTKSPELQ